MVIEGACRPQVERLYTYRSSTAVSSCFCLFLQYTDIFPSTTVPLVDSNHRVMGLIAYGDPSITKCAEDAAKLICETRPAASFTGKGIDNRRGYFGNLNAGVAHGGGRLVSS